MTGPATPTTSLADEAQRAQRARALAWRQLIVTVLGLGVIAVVMAFTRNNDPTGAAASGAADVYLKAHQQPDDGILRLAYLQLAVVAAVALIAIGHAVHVAKFVLRLPDRNLRKVAH